MNTGGDKDKPRQSANTTSESRGARQIPVRENRIDSTDLFIGGKEIVIAHGAELYRLRLTAQHKLILTK
jgi:hemin uptake protein HemP